MTTKYPAFEVSGSKTLGMMVSSYSRHIYTYIYDICIQICKYVHFYIYIFVYILIYIHGVMQDFHHPPLDSLGRPASRQTSFKARHVPGQDQNVPIATNGPNSPYTVGSKFLYERCHVRVLRQREEPSCP